LKLDDYNGKGAFGAQVGTHDAHPQISNILLNANLDKLILRLIARMGDPSNPALK
jgi:hypothetical protein